MLKLSAAGTTAFLATVMLAACSGDGGAGRTSGSDSGVTVTAGTDTTDTSGTSASSGTSESSASGTSGESTTTGSGSDSATSGAPKFDVGIETTGGSETCDVIMFEAKAQRPDIVFVLDKSGSMDFNFWDFNNQNMNRWDSLYLTVESVLTEFEDKADFGAELFPTRNAVDGECNADTPITAVVAPLNAANILASIPQLGESVRGQTPMGHGVTVGRDHLVAIKSDKPQAMILVADGGVSTNCNSPNSVAEIENILSGMAAQEVYTYVVGIDADTASLVDQLNAFAVAGGQPLAGAEKFYNAQDGNALLMKMGEIVEGVLSCTIKLENVPEYPDFTKVVIDGMEWLLVNDCNTEDGWIWSNEFDEITLCGAACNDLKTKGELQVEFACPEG